MRETATYVYRPGAWSYNKETKTFSAECSDIAGGPSKQIVLMCPGKYKVERITFEHYATDMDGTNEDTYGWRYRSVSGAKFPCELLLIND